ncbi:MAG: efflux RND transporter periplasmic adaptor subunit [Anaerolineae bacterium]|nr:efflux RND transporter periplasmic adaptor subunit [Gloeobacterales cyanobacterium ES-bin-313]
MRHRWPTNILGILLPLFLGQAAFAQGMGIARPETANRLISTPVLLGLFVFVIGLLLLVAVLFSRRGNSQIKEKGLFFGSKTALALGVFGTLAGSILILTNLFKPTSVMDGMQGMEGMSMEEMMQVDGAANPVPVRVERVRSAIFKASIRYTGSVRPYQEATVYPRIEGRLTDYSVYPGDQVRVGQTLARLSAEERSGDVEMANADVEATKAGLQASQVELDEHHEEVAQMAAQYAYWEDELPRAQTLLAKGVISQEEFDKENSEAMAARATLRAVQVKLQRLKAEVARSRAMVLQSQAKARNARIMQSYTVLDAPIAGVVEERLVDPGVFVQPGTGVLKVADYSKVRLQANVAQEDLIGVQLGSVVEVRTGRINKSIGGRVTSIFPKAGDETRTVTVEALVNNPGNGLRAGQFLEMSLVTGQKANALSISKSALAQFEGKPVVWVVAGKFAQRKPITVGLTDSERVEITSGLNAGDAVITSGQDRLTISTRVTAVDNSGQPIATLDSGAMGGNVQVQLISPTKPSMGDNRLILQVKDSKTGQPLKVENIEVNIAMPMQNMSPMAADVEVKPDKQPGSFIVNTYLGMEGTWEVTAKVKDPTHQGVNSFPLDNRQSQGKQ